MAARAWRCGRGVETRPSLVISKLEPRSKKKTLVYTINKRRGKKNLPWAQTTISSFGPHVSIDGRHPLDGRGVGVGVGVGGGKGLRRAVVVAGWWGGTATVVVVIGSGGGG